ncbi:MAG: hypothetical protein ACI9UT_001349 [Flavobacteriales bacterium]|jgi:hypothetical protein
MISSQRDWLDRFISNIIINDIKIKPQSLVVRYVVLKVSALDYISESVIFKHRSLQSCDDYRLNQIHHIVFILMAYKA